MINHAIGAMTSARLTRATALAVQSAPKAGKLPRSAPPTGYVSRPLRASQSWRCARACVAGQADILCSTAALAYADLRTRSCR
jgi:hypothetical protein